MAKTERKTGQPHDPEIVEPGPTPPNAERHGVWRILAVSLTLAIVGLAIVGFYFL